MAEKIGVDAVWNNANFNKGQADYMKSMLQSQNITGAVTGTMNQMGLSSGGLGGLLSNLASTLGMSTGGMLALGGAIGIGVGAFNMISSAVSSFTDFMFKGADSALMVASRVEQLNLIAQTLAANQGMNGEAVNELVAALNKQGISMSVSNMTVAQFARMNLDLAQSTQLAAVAQDAATISNEGSSDALEGLLHGIQTLNIRVLRQHGILVEAETAYKNYAEANNIAGRELSSNEKQQAFLNAVIENGSAVAGAYAASMMTAGKQLGSMTSRVIPDLKNALGAPLQGAFYNVVKGINDMLDGFRSMVSEGGVLYPFMVQLGAALQVLTDPIREIGAAFKETQDGPIADFATGITDMISRMAQWGVDLIVNFSTGIINAASTVLVTAINFVSNMLSGWFMPGSPPKVAPEIDVWGAETMEEYLMGFSDADFDLLNNIQNQLKNAFKSLADMGSISQEAASTMWSQFSEEFIKAISSGELTQAMLDEVKSAGGVYGEQLAKMAQEQFAVSQALEQTKKAEEALTAAKERSSKAGAKVNKGLMEYNQMLRSGASKEALAAKLAEINASKKEQQDAEAGIGVAEENVSVAKENLDALRQQAALTEQVLQNMIELNQAQIDAAKAAQAAKETPKTPAAGGAAAAAGAPDIGGLGEGGGFDPDSIVNPMREAVNKAADEIKARLFVAWATIKRNVITAWNEAMWNIKQALDKSGLTEKWETIKKAAAGVWEWIQKKASDVIFYLKRYWSRYGDDIIFVFQKISNFLAPIIGFIKDVLIGNLIGYFNMLWLVIRSVFTIIWSYIRMALEVVGGIIAAFADVLRGNWDAAWQHILDIFTNVWRIAQQTVSEVFGYIKDYINGQLEVIRGIWDDIWTKVSTKVVEIWTAIVTWVTTKALEIKTAVDTFAADVVKAWETFWDGVNTKVTDIWTAIVTWVTTKIGEIKTTVDTITGEIRTAWDTFWDGVQKKADDIWTAINTAVSTAIGTVKKTISDAFEGVGGIFSLFTGWVNTATQFGADIVNGIATGVGNVIDGVVRTVTGAVQSIIDAIKLLLGIKSPSKVFAEFGKATMQGMEIGINRNAADPANAMRRAAVQTVSAAAVPITMGATNYYQPSINMTNYINNGMNVPQLEALIIRSVKRGITR